jgi:hypothetical protein
LIKPIHLLREIRNGLVFLGDFDSNIINAVLYNMLLCFCREGK